MQCASADNVQTGESFVLHRGRAFETGRLGDDTVRSALPAGVALSTTDPSFLTACAAACLRDRSRPRIALAKCSRNDFDGQATKPARPISAAPPSLLWHVRGDPLKVCD
jgi:hypothetical protein